MLWSMLTSPAEGALRPHSSTPSTGLLRRAPPRSTTSSHSLRSAARLVSGLLQQGEAFPRRVGQLSTERHVLLPAAAGRLRWHRSAPHRPAIRSARARRRRRMLVERPLGEVAAPFPTNNPSADRRRGSASRPRRRPASGPRRTSSRATRPESRTLMLSDRSCSQTPPHKDRSELPRYGTDDQQPDVRALAQASDRQQQGGNALLLAQRADEDRDHLRVLPTQADGGPPRRRFGRRPRREVDVCTPITETRGRVLGKGERRINASGAR